MTAQQRKASYFLELTGDKQREADEWLRGYLRLVIRIHRAHLFVQQATIRDGSQVDAHSGTGKLCTPEFGNPPLHP